ncbi:HD-GYP domain-containing protein [Thermomonas fusca]|uniref:HD-GYP domain-containing protein n=1 Tax=Thermomonas fusca TaxID=215690 RepID=A0A5R9PCA4_9GAMM|nr:HD-GYP domain-containing protein [Thermomonas fusca]TLX20717.1 HD-GYP domain-containing protein [Thermomonas fusca]
MSSIRRIPAASLRTGMYLHKIGGSWLSHPFLRNSFLLVNPEDVRRIVEAGIESVWVDESRGDALQDAEGIGEAPCAHTTDEDPARATLPGADAQAPAFTTRPRTPLADVSMEAELARARNICLAGKAQVAEMFAELRLGKTVSQESVLPLVDEIASSVYRNPAALISVARLKTHDDYSYLHSVAVSALMLALARQLKLDERLVRIAGIGGLMHDLGKAFMPLEILNKPGRLTDEEFAIMKRHSGAGAQALQEGGCEPDVVDIVLHHHERMDGRGYPHGLREDEISLLARMGAVCDVYDAVTSVRPYKRPWDPAMAMREMARWDGHFDTRVFNAFVKSVGIYPVGSLVRLSSERLAVILEPGVDSLLRPIVSAFYSIRSREKILPQTLDLAAPDCRDSIVSPESPEQWGLGNLEALWL